MESGFLSAAFFSSLFSIVLMDLVLAGDNALVIGLTARSLPRDKQRMAIIGGTLGAIVVRGVMAVLVVYILNVPGFMLAGGIALVWISRKLLKPEPAADSAHAAQAPTVSLLGAVRTIVIADAVMGIDNVLAIGGAAHGSVALVVLGLAISVPIMVWGSQLIIRLVDRYPSVILLGGAVLAWTAYSMVAREPHLRPWLAGHGATRPVLAALVFSLSLAPWYMARLPAGVRPLVKLLPALLVWMLAFEAAATIWSVQVDHLLATASGEYLVEGLRWIGWLPLAAAFLWLRERASSSSARLHHGR